jgi:hypothetical protein
MAEVAHGSVTDSFADALTNTDDLCVVTVKNALNADLYVNFSDSGTANQWKLLAGDTQTWDFCSNGIHHAADVRIKYSSAPSSGSVLIMGAAK